MIEDVDDAVDELPDKDFFKATARVFDKIDNVKDFVLLPLKFVDLIGGVFIVRS